MSYFEDQTTANSDLWLCRESTICGESNIPSSSTSAATILTADGHTVAEVDTVEEQDGFKCGNCNKVYTSKRLLNKHAKIHDQSQWKKVCNCGKRFMYAKDLKRHVSVHSDRKFPCPLIGDCQTELQYHRDNVRRHLETQHSLSKNEVEYYFRLFELSADSSAQGFVEYQPAF